MYHNSQFIQPIPAEPGAPRKHPRSGRILRRAALLAVSTALLGGIAGSAFYGVNALMENAFAAQGATAAQSSSLALTALSYVSTANETEAASLDVSDIAAQGLSSVVSVTNISVQEVQSYFGQMGRAGRAPVQLQETTSCGSGVIIHASDANLYLVTNEHVVQGASTLSVTFADGQTYEAQLCGCDASLDIAVLKVPIDSLSEDTLAAVSVATIEDSDALVVGEQVVAIGNALGYGQSVTTGIVSALNRAVSTDTSASTYIQTDAAINPGNSGGALLNMEGELIGINTAKVSSTEVEGMGYAIPVSQILDVIASLMSEASI